MTEQAVAVMQIIPGPVDPGLAEHGLKLVRFVDADGKPVDVGGGGADIPEVRLVPEGGTVGQVVKRGEGGTTVWAADQNVAYPPIVAAELVTGTSTTQSTISPKVFADEVERRINVRVAAAIQPFEARIAALEAKGA